METALSRTSSMTAALSLLKHNRLLPSKAKVSESHAEDDGQTQPAVVRHEDEHEEVGDEQLDHVEQGLDHVEPAPHVRLQGLDPLLHLGWWLRVLIVFKKEKGLNKNQRILAVSYTHLTLPTIYSV